MQIMPWFHSPTLDRENILKSIYTYFGYALCTLKLEGQTMCQMSTVLFPMVCVNYIFYILLVLLI